MVCKSLPRSLQGNSNSIKRHRSLEHFDEIWQTVEEAAASDD